MKARTLVIAFSLLFLMAPLRAAQKPAAPQKASAPLNDSIRREDMKPDIEFMALDLLKGRLTGTPEAAITAEFIKSRFERLGLKPVGPRGSYFQPYTLYSATLGPGNQLETIPPAGAPYLRRLLRPGQDYYPLRFSANAVGRGEVVYVGFGIRPEDYRNFPAGSIALALDHEPGENDPNSPFDGLITSEASNALRKALLAQDRGAVGILFVQDIHNHPPAPNLEASGRGYWPAERPRVEPYVLGDLADKVRIPAAQISVPFAEALVKSAGRGLMDLAKAAEAPAGLDPVKLSGSELELTASIDRRANATRNVLGLIEGSDVRLKDEWIIICAHFDHLGADAIQYFPGADDDGAGIAAVIDIAEAYVLAAQAGQRPKRSILFAAWDAEERGLLGAWAYAERPLNPLEKTPAVLNLDMISRNEEVPPGDQPRFRGLDPQSAESNSNTVNVLGLTRFPALKPEVDKANQPFSLTLKTILDNNASQLLRRSDHWPFMNKGVPAIWFLTGLHPDYHTANDRPERLNYEKMERIARLVHQMSWNIAQQGPTPGAK